MGSRTAIVAVTNDLTTDRRVARTCDVLRECGYRVVLVGRKLRSEAELPYADEIKRLDLIFNNGPFFYAEFNIRLFILLLIRPCELVFSNDLDTLLACWMAKSLKRCELIYDSHEYFTEVPELKDRTARRVWLAIERYIFPRLKHVITVNGSIADVYNELYGVLPVVVRNLGPRPTLSESPSRKSLGIPVDKVVLVLQGNGINLDRGGEEAVLAMRHLPDVHLLIIGSGDAWHLMEQLIVQNALHDRVRMIARLPYEQMMNYTMNADIGLSLDKDTNLNYRYSLPNKLFDYHYAGLAIVASNLPEVAAVVRQFQSGVLLNAITVDSLVSTISQLVSDKERLRTLQQNAKFAAAELDPAEERKRLKEVILRVE